MRKVAMITGVTGQDGAYLTELLINKGYMVHGMKRRASSFNTARVDHLFEELADGDTPRFRLHYGDMTDSTNLIRIIQEIKPDEIYNLAAQSHVRVSFDTPEYTANADAVGVLRLLEALRILGRVEETRFYQAGTSEMYGLVQETPQTEGTPFYPRSPYGVAKLYGHWITINYREAYGLYACNGILFNHESPVRGETFLSRKVTRAAARIALGLQTRLQLGNLDAKRDWGHAADYVEAMWLMLQQDEPDDYVVATGVTTEVREFVRTAFAQVGIGLEFSGKGVDEIGQVSSLDEGLFESRVGRTCAHLRIGDKLISIESRYFRPTEVDLLLGDSTKARDKLGWEPKHTLSGMIADMVEHDLEEAKRSKLLSDHGHDLAAPSEA